MDAASNPFPNSAITLGSALIIDADELILSGDPNPLLPRLGELLIQYHALLDGAVAVVSGLSLAEVDAALAPHVLPIVACTGYESRIPPEPPHLDPPPSGLPTLIAMLTAYPPALDRVEVSAIASGVDVRVHAKAHQLESNTQYLQDIVRTVPGFQLQRRLNRFQIQPTSLRKRRLIATLLRYRPFRNARMVLLGDNRLSIDAMRVVEADGGMSLRVGAQFSSAERGFPDWSAVTQWLKDQEPSLCALHSHSDGF